MTSRELLPLQVSSAASLTAVASGFHCFPVVRRRFTTAEVSTKVSKGQSSKMVLITAILYLTTIALPSGKCVPLLVA